ncbi:hypothetical protein C8N47_109142 [Mangrovibacterium marinum]|uniref:Uncharacterized protein n=1 Tax=Mangrovibacterium marinum TaxID=1639118 RepID=A0A2T5C190_9BACT|nr:hypothetical protein C8N47_109142 [Mangrovibacterium marinum]
MIRRLTGVRCKNLYDNQISETRCLFGLAFFFLFNGVIELLKNVNNSKKYEKQNGRVSVVLGGQGSHISNLRLFFSIFDCMPVRGIRSFTSRCRLLTTTESSFGAPGGQPSEARGWRCFLTLTCSCFSVTFNNYSVYYIGYNSKHAVNCFLVVVSSYEHFFVLKY